MRPDVFLGPHVRAQNYDGAWDLVRWSKAKFKATNMDLSAANVTYDLVLLISPEYELELSQKMVRVMRPTLLVVMMHNGNYEHMEGADERLVIFWT